MVHPCVSTCVRACLAGCVAGGVFAADPTSACSVFCACAHVHTRACTNTNAPTHAHSHSHKHWLRLTWFLTFSRNLCSTPLCPVSGIHFVHLGPNFIFHRLSSPWHVHRANCTCFVWIMPTFRASVSLKCASPTSLPIHAPLGHPEPGLQGGLHPHLFFSGTRCSG